MNTSPAVSQMSSPGIQADRNNSHMVNSGAGTNGSGGSNANANSNDRNGNSGGQAGAGNNTGTNNTAAGSANAHIINGQDTSNRSSLGLSSTPDNRNGLANMNNNTDRTTNGILHLDRNRVDMNPISLMQDRNRQIALHERVLQERMLHERVLQERALHERVLLQERSGMHPPLVIPSHVLNNSHERANEKTTSGTGGVLPTMTSPGPV